jgi:hypothetical protein
MTGGTQGNGFGTGMGHPDLGNKVPEWPPELVMFPRSPQEGGTNLASLGAPPAAPRNPAGVRHSAVTSSGVTARRGASRRIAANESFINRSRGSISCAARRR